MKKIALVNGPNLDRLGKREPQIYGSKTLQDLESEMKSFAAKLGVELLTFQSNHEGEIIDQIGKYADEKIDGLIINPAAFTHTSVALRDAISASNLRAVEVHISNVHAREEFRHKSFTAGVCVAQICGLGFDGYRVALEFLAK